MSATYTYYGISVDGGEVTWDPNAVTDVKYAHASAQAELLSFTKPDANVTIVTGESYEVIAHIRKKAGPSLGNQYYSHAHRAQFRGGYVDPQGQTLCGAKATTEDQSWAETRFPKGRGYVDCAACIAERLKDPKARK